MEVKRLSSGAIWEPKVGYCRAVRAGDLIFISGTAAVDEGGGIAAPGDAYGQARRCLELIVAALSGLGADASHVVRTRMFVRDASRWEEIGRAHREVFGANPPATSMIEVKGFVHPEMLIEIEADAVAPQATRRPPRKAGRTAAKRSPAAAMRPGRRR
jgi:isochorismate pyruvate lyase